MKKKVYKKLILSFVILSLILAIFSTLFLRFNISNSIPRGIYRVSLDKEYGKGDYVVFYEPGEYEKYYSEKIKKLPPVKKIAGMNGDIVEIKDNKVFVNNKEVGNIEYDIPLKISGKYTLKEDEYYLLGENNNSLDSRYYGVIYKKDILYKVYPVWRF